MRRVPSFFLLLLFLASGCGGSRDADSPEGPQVLAAETLRAWMVESRRVALLDIRPPHLFDEARLPGAVAAGGRTLRELREVLPVNPEVPIVFYNQDGERPPDPGEDLAGRAADYGFSQVFWLKEGVEGWERLGYPVSGFRSPGR